MMYVLAWVLPAILIGGLGVALCLPDLGEKLRELREMADARAYDAEGDPR